MGGPAAGEPSLSLPPWSPSRPGSRAPPRGLDAESVDVGAEVPNEEVSQVPLAPEVQLRLNQGDIFVWWQCHLCGYRVFTHKELTHTQAAAARVNHLAKKHRVPRKEIADSRPEDLKLDRAACQKFNTRMRAQIFSQLVMAKGWSGLHKVEYCQKGHW